MNKNGSVIVWVIISVAILLGAIYILFLYKGGDKIEQQLEQEINQTIEAINNMSIVSPDMTFEELKARIDAINNQTLYLKNLSLQKEETPRRRGGGGGKTITPPAPLY